MNCPKYIDKYHRVDLYERNKNAQFSGIFGGGWQLKWQFSNFRRFRKKLKRFRTFEWYFRKQLTIEVIWAKCQEIQNFTTVIAFSVFTGIGS